MYCQKTRHLHNRKEVLEIRFIMKNIEEKSSYHSMVKDASVEMKHAVVNQNLCCVGSHFCGENGEGVRAAAMGKRGR
jgi:alpha-galactosidase/6-phospho-beta-glucosidase family protein